MLLDVSTILMQPTRFGLRRVDKTFGHSQGSGMVTRVGIDPTTY